MRSRAIVVLVLSIVMTGAAFAQVTLVKDINTTSPLDPFAPSVLVAVGSNVFYVPSGPSFRPYQLWKSDGTVAGTVLVKDLCPAANCTGYVTLLTNVNGTLFFVVDNRTNGKELWKSDGTTAGTVLVKDICPGACGSSLYSLTNVNSTVFFFTNDGVHGDQLWKSDGTAAGTVKVSDICANCVTYFGSVPVRVGGNIFFLTHDPATSAMQLWKSDGTTPGTVIVKGICSSSCSLYVGFNPTDVNGTLFFTAGDDVQNVTGLWRSDGTAAGTTIMNTFPYIRECSPNACGPAPNPSNLTNLNGALLFVASDGVHGYELWKSDGTAAGTTMVTNTFGSIGNQITGALDGLTDVNGTLLFSTNDRGHGQLWKSDGTAAGTMMVKDICPGSCTSVPDNLTNVNGTLFFTDRVNGQNQGGQLWKSNGTAAGTTLVRNICLNGNCQIPYALTNANGTLFFVADDGVNGYELWNSDGTAARTFMLSLPRYQNVPNSSYPNGLTDVGGTLFFSADDGDYGAVQIHGDELWRSDGTAAGTWMVKDICPGVCSSSPSNLTNVNGTLFFTVYGGTQLWQSDGTEAGTVLVKNCTTPCSSLLSNLTNVNGTLFFIQSTLSGGYDLWKSDGTAAGTIMMKSGIAPSLVNVNGTLFFTANDYSTGDQLWKSDGTVAGTIVVKDICSGSCNAYPGALTNVNGTLFFTADDQASFDRTLWKTNGTAAGTMMVKDICPGCAYPQNLTDVNGTLFFTADDGNHGLELWKSDGTAAGTIQLKDICSGCPPQPASLLTTVNGILFFVANDPARAQRPTLWRSDGTTAGTFSLYNSTFDGPMAPEDLYADGNRLLCWAVPGYSFKQLWQSDGSVAGTTLFAVINPNGDSAPTPPPNFARSGSSVFFSANDGTTGFELWKTGTAMFTATAMSLAAGANPSTAGASLTFTATVAAPFSVSQPTGTVTFMDGATTLGVGTPLGGGAWSFTTSSLPVGIHFITALFGSSSAFLPSTSPVLNQIVLNGGASASTTTLAVNGLAAPTTVYFGVVKGAFGAQGANFVVTVNGSNDGDQVVLMEGNRPLGPMLMLASGQASYRTQLAVGQHVISAIYFGNGTTEAGSLSPTIIVNRSPRPLPK